MMKCFKIKLGKVNERGEITKRCEMFSSDEVVDDTLNVIRLAFPNPDISMDKDSIQEVCFDD